jgi:hypothetical protein
MEISKRQGYAAQGTAATHNELAQNTGTTEYIHTTGQQGRVLRRIQTDATVIV